MEAKLKVMRVKVKKIGAIVKPVNAMRDSLIKNAEAWANDPTDENGDRYPGPKLYQATKRKVKEAFFQSLGEKKKDPFHKKWNGGGRIAVQFQHQQDKKEHPATLQNIRDGLWSKLLTIDTIERFDKNKDRLGQPCKPVTVFRLRIASDENRRPVFIDCPCVVDKEWDWPEDAYCTWIYLNCRRRGREYVYSLSFHLAREAGWKKEDKASGGVVAAWPGYRKVEDESIRVITWKADDGETGDLLIPRDDVLIDHDDYWQRKTIRGISYAKKFEDLQEIRENLFNMIKRELGQFFKRSKPKWSAPIREWLDNVVKIENMKKKVTGSKTRLLQLLNDWRKQPWPEELKKKIGEWCYKEIHLERWQTNQSAKWNRHRLERYRTFWAQLRRRYNTVILPNINWAKLRQNPPPEEQKNPALIENRNVASPGLMASLAPEPFLKIHPGRLASTCHECGKKCKMDGAKSWHQCEHCDAVWDKDANSVANLLDRGLELIEQGEDADDCEWHDDERKAERRSQSVNA